MNKTELIDALAKGADVSKKDAGAVLDTFVKVVTDELAKKEKVQLPEIEQPGLAEIPRPEQSLRSRQARHRHLSQVRL